MTRLDGAVVAITGAGGGIGRATAVELARRGADVAVSDLDLEAARGTVELVERQGRRGTAHAVDVTDAAAVSAWADAVVADHGGVNVLVNNAGMIMTATADEQDVAAVDRVLGVDLHGVVNGTQAFLPHLIASRSGHVVNLSSILGIVASPTLTAYNAAKFAVRGWSQALALDMQMQGHPVEVTCVHPGAVRTDLANNAAVVGGVSQEGVLALFDRMAVTRPEGVARAIANGIRFNRRTVIVGPDGWTLWAGERLLGSQFNRVLGHVAGLALRAYR